MTSPTLSRRSLLAAAPATLAAASCALGATPSPSAIAEAKKMIRYCFNTSTIRGQKLPLAKVVDIASKAGYNAIEPWIGEIEDHVKAGGTTADLKKQIADAGMTVESAIGFAEWIVDDDEKRAKGLEHAKRDMDLVKSIGGIRIAAPPAGATNQTDLNLTKAAQRYRSLCELGAKMEVIPQVEVWGFSKSLSRLSETMFVALESAHKDACILPDVYHLYKGGTDFDVLGLLGGVGVHVFHMNDYPDMPRDKINDSDRVYPGDGIAPLKFILQTLIANGFRGVLSLELFNNDYYKQDPLTVAKTGLAKMKAAVEAAS